AQPDLDAVVAEGAEPEVQAKALDAERDRCRTARDRLDGALDLEARLPEYTVAVADLAARVGRRAKERDELVDSLAQRPHVRAALRDRRDELAAAAAGLADAQVALAERTARQEAAALVAELTPQVAAAEEAAQVAARA